MSYFKAEISISTERMELNSDGVYEGHDPDTFQDHGIVETLTATTLDELKRKIEKRYVSIKGNGCLFDGCLELQYEGEYHYNTPPEERVPFTETARIIISEVSETVLDISNVFPELKDGAQ